MQMRAATSWQERLRLKLSCMMIFASLSCAATCMSFGVRSAGARRRRTQQQVDDAGQNLLEAAALLLRRAQRQFVEIDDILVITDVEKRPVRVEELRADLAVDVGAGESDPVLVPAGLGRGAGSCATRRGRAG